MASFKLILIVAIIAVQQLAACQAAELGEQNKKQDSAGVKIEADKDLVPVMVMKQQEGKESKPDWILIWIKPYEQFIPSQVMDMINSQVRPQTEQISGQISNVPGSSQAYEMISQGQSTIAGMMGGSGSGGSNPLSSIMGRRR